MNVPIKNFIKFLSIINGSVAAPLGFEPRQPPSEGYHSFLATTCFHVHNCVVVWIILLPYLAT